MSEMSSSAIDAMIKENARRLAVLDTPYDPLTGMGCTGSRVKITLPFSSSELWLPEAMLEDPLWAAVSSEEEMKRLRVRYDFEFWAASAVTIRHKITGKIVRLTLNRPQRKVLAALEEDRVAGRPIRLVLLKARQWGGSTLIQMYFAWIQLVHCRNWNSLICSHVKGTSRTIRGMYSLTLSRYPDWLIDPDEPKPALRPFEGSADTRVIAGRDCCITIASSYTQEGVRGLDYSLAHLTEVAFWRDTDTMTPEAFLRAINGGIPLAPLTAVVIESTANGVGNLFHHEWLRAERSQSGMRAVFVAWHEIEIYSLECAGGYRELIASMDSYEHSLWQRGATLEAINWYRHKMRSFASHADMKAEYPSDPVEAFINTGHGVFSPEHVESMRAGCCAPVAIGEVAGQSMLGADALHDIKFTPDSKGQFAIWEMPDTATNIMSRYVVAVDIGGRSQGSDWSVIAVIDRAPGDDPMQPPRVVAQWRGHIDHDLLGWKAVAIARWYANALLVIESNTLESSATTGSQYILEELCQEYDNMYRRVTRDSVTSSVDSRVGFHTNRRTKDVIITSLIAMVRESSYIERDAMACDEMSTYEQLPSGAYAARQGYHDDILMTRAMGLYVASTLSVTHTPGPDTFMPLSKQ